MQASILYAFASSTGDCDGESGGGGGCDGGWWWWLLVGGGSRRRRRKSSYKCDQTTLAVLSF